MTSDSVAQPINLDVSDSGVSRRVAENELRLRVVFQSALAQSHETVRIAGQKEPGSHLCGGGACE